MRRHIVPIVLCFAAASGIARADDINQIDQLNQADFRNLSRDLTAAVSYKAVVPIEALGLTGFDVGVEVTATQLEHRSAWNNATLGSAPSTLYIPKVHVHKGLPAGFDVGLFYASVADSNIDIWGAEVRYALVEGGIGTPAVGLRGTYSKVSGVDQLAFNTKGVELGISKGFAFFTPYAGIGRIWADAEPVGPAVAHAEDFSETKLFVGGNINFIAGNLALEADRIGDTVSYSAKFGFRF